MIIYIGVVTIFFLGGLTGFIVGWKAGIDAYCEAMERVKENN